MTEELYLAVVADDVEKTYSLIESGAKIDHVFNHAYSCPEGYTSLMAAAHRNHLEVARALLRSGANSNYCNEAGDLTIFWAIDGGVEMVQLFVEHGSDLNTLTCKGWSPLSYAIAKGKYGPTEKAGIYPEDVLKYYGAKVLGTGPEALGGRSPRESFNPEAKDFMRERGTYQDKMAAP
jgi:ankyrin repeat protein